MAEVNIQMKRRNGDIWDSLFPVTKAENVIETATKKFVSDSQINSWNSKLDGNLKGANNGVAELDASGKVPANQLPSYVDDVLEFDSFASFPTTGETGKIYIAIDTNKSYRWSGTTYVELTSSVALGETSSTAYRGDRGKIAYDHSQSPHARADATKTEQSSTNGNIKIDGVETKVYEHPTGAGDRHIPSGGSAGQILQYGGSSGTAVWADPTSGMEIIVSENEPSSPSAGDFWYEVV